MTQIKDFFPSGFLSQISTETMSKSLPPPTSQKERNLSRVRLILLFTFSLASIFVLHTFYSPKTSKITSKQDFNQNNLHIRHQKGIRQSRPIFYYDENCDLFMGRWVPDPNGSNYTNRSCLTIPDSKNCAKNGREDKDFLHWRWKPDHCELPRFDARNFLSIVRGKKMAFIGDSVARNHMESLLCLLSLEEAPIDLYRDSEDRFRTWYLPSYDFTLMVLWTKFLVAGEERVVNGTLSGVYDIHIDKIDIAWSEKLPEVHFAILSGGHWFFRKIYVHQHGEVIGCVFCNEVNLTDFKPSYAIRRVFRSALKHIRGCKWCGPTITVVRTFSPAHFEHGEWNTGGRCNRTSPLIEGEVAFRGFEWEIRESQVREVKRVNNKGNKGGKRFGVLDVTRPMLLRADGHPGFHWDNRWMKGYSDCVHWCLPGPIDVWNDFLLAVLKKESTETSFSAFLA